MCWNHFFKLIVYVSILNFIRIIYFNFIHYFILEYTKEFLLTESSSIMIESNFFVFFWFIFIFWWNIRRNFFWQYNNLHTIILIDSRLCILCNYIPCFFAKKEEKKNNDVQNSNSQIPFAKFLVFDNNIYIYNMINFTYDNSNNGKIRRIYLCR